MENSFAIRESICKERIPKKQEYLNYFLVLLLLFISGNPLVSSFSRYIYIFSLFGIILCSPIKCLIKPKTSLIVILSVVLITFVFQKAALGYVSVAAGVNFLAKLLLGYFILQIVGNAFISTFLKLMYFLCLISLVFFAIFIVFGKIPEILTFNRYSSVIFYNQIVEFPMEIEYKNSGMFWEPGAFQGYINLVFLLFIDKLSYLWSYHKKEVIVLTIALLTTQSTTGYIVFFTILLYHFIFDQKRKSASMLMAIILAGIVAMSFLNFDFLGSKINEQWKISKKLDVKNGEVSWNRFGEIYTDWHYIQKHPLFGNGLNSKTRWADHSFLSNEDLEGFGNGFTWMTASMGIVFMVAYFICIFIELPFNRKSKLFFILFILLLLQGEQFMNYPLFMALPFIGLIFSNKSIQTYNFLNAQNSRLNNLSQP